MAPSLSAARSDAWAQGAQPAPYSRHRGLRSIWLLALAILPLPALAEPSAQQQEAMALARLSTPGLRDYFDARRQLERRGSEQRLSDLRQLEDCLERTRLRSGAETCLAQGRQRQWQQRQQWQTELAGLRQRYGLPNLDGAPQSLVPQRPYGVPIQPRTGWVPNRVPVNPWQPQAQLPYGWY